MRTAQLKNSKPIIGPSDHETARWLTACIEGASKIPKKYWHLDSEHPRVKHYAEAFAQMAERYNTAEFRNNGKGFYVWGAEQTGKTSICVLFIREVLRIAYQTRWTTKSVLFVDANDVYRALRRPGTVEFNSTEPGQQFLDQVVVNVDILLISHLGDELRSDEFGPMLAGLLRKRSGQLLLTCITSFQSPQEFGDVYGDELTRTLRGLFEPIGLGETPNVSED